jgi:ketol-acid reductoisomerase
MKNRYMVEMWKDGIGVEAEDFVWYHAKPKDAKEWARAYAKKIGAQAFIVLDVFNTGHYRTIHSENVNA